MRCRVMVDIPGSGGFGQHQCYEPLNDQGECPHHGLQVMVKPDWMSDEQWKNSLSNLQRHSVVIRHRRTNTPDGRASRDDSGK